MVRISELLKKQAVWEGRTWATIFLQNVQDQKMESKSSFCPSLAGFTISKLGLYKAVSWPPELDVEKLQ